MHSGSEPHRFRDGEHTTRLGCVRSQMVPVFELLDRHAEAIGDGDERIAVTHGVVLGMVTGRDRGDRNDQLVPDIDRLACGDAVGFGDLAGSAMKRRCDAVERLACTLYMKAPACALFFWNVLDALIEDITHANGKIGRASCRERVLMPV